MSFLYAQPNWRFVDQAFTGDNSDGSFFLPHRFFNPILVRFLIPAGGAVWIQPGNYASAGRYDKAMTLQAPLGGVVLGQ